MFRHNHAIIREYTASLKPLTVKWITSVNFTTISTGINSFHFSLCKGVIKLGRYDPAFSSPEDTWRSSTQIVVEIYLVVSQITPANRRTRITVRKVSRTQVPFAWTDILSLAARRIVPIMAGETRDAMYP